MAHQLSRKEALTLGVIWALLALILILATAGVSFLLHKGSRPHMDSSHLDKPRAVPNEPFPQ